MRHDSFHLHPDHAAHYCVQAQGQVNPGWLEMLSGVWQISPSHAATPGTTILVGDVLDQAALLGDLQLLSSLGLALLRVECLGPAAASRADAEGSLGSP
jgi:hypothetical protein